MHRLALFIAQMQEAYIMVTQKCARLGLALAVLVSLTACGEGYEAIRTTDVFPYGNQRTAGSTIMYVQKKMMPAKTLKVEPQPAIEDVMTTPKPEPETIDLSADEMEDLFRAAQRK
jgi:hypothetical protein